MLNMHGEYKSKEHKNETTSAENSPNVLDDTVRFSEILAINSKNRKLAKRRLSGFFHFGKFGEANILFLRQQEGLGFPFYLYYRLTSNGIAPYARQTRVSSARPLVSKYVSLMVGKAFG